MTLDAKIKAVGFDMDGTVMNTKVDYVKLAYVVRDEFVEQGVPQEAIDLDTKDNSMVHGLKWLKENKPEALKTFDKKIGDRATAVELEHSDIAKPYPGAREIIEKIRSMGYRTAILTRGGREYATKILTASGMIDLFDALVARDDYAYGDAKPNRKAMEHMCEKLGVKCDEVLYVGDGTADYLVTVNSGSQFVGVETHMTRAEWEKLGGPSIVTVPTVADLDRFL